MGIDVHTFGACKVRVWSAGSGSPLLYLHGLEGHPGDAPFLQQLAATRRVIAPELPGYGESDGIECIDGVLAVSLHHRRLVQALAGGPVDVVGHSLGGMLAAEFAIVSPHLTRRLVLVDAYGLWRDDAPLPDPFVMTADELRTAKWANIANAASETSVDRPDAANPGADALLRARNLGASTKFMWPIPDRGLRTRLDAIEAPTLIVHGAQDGLVPAIYADEFAALIPAARSVRIDQAGHLPMIEQPGAFQAAVGSFLSG